MDTRHDMNASPTVRNGIRLAVAFAQFAVASAGVSAIDPAQAPSPAPLTSAQAVLAQMAADRKSLNSYEVAIHFDIHFHKYITLHLGLDGVRYFQRPDNEALHMHAIPVIAHAFQHIYGALGTPETWPRTYDIAFVGWTRMNGRIVYRLNGVPKTHGNVDHIYLDVAGDDLAPLKVQWFYRNGGTIVMTIDAIRAGGLYELPKTEVIDIEFPDYNAHAVADYGDYQLNIAIPETVFSPQP